MSNERDWEEDTLPRAKGQQDPDHTVVTPRPQSAGEQDFDLTVVTPRPKPADEQDPDHTVVASSPDPDQTVATPRPKPKQDPDHTVAAPRPEPDPERTVATGSPAVQRKSRRSLRRRERAREQRGVTAAPVSDQQQRAPWSAMVYGPRHVPAPTSGDRSDAVLRTIGAPPAAVATPPASERSQLPSLTRRFTRVRVWSLAAYGGSVVVAVVGLTIVGRIAFG